MRLVNITDFRVHILVCVRQWWLQWPTQQTSYLVIINKLCRTLLIILPIFLARLHLGMQHWRFSNQNIRKKYVKIITSQIPLISGKEKNRKKYLQLVRKQGLWKIKKPLYLLEEDGDDHGFSKPELDQLCKSTSFIQPSLSW